MFFFQLLDEIIGEAEFPWPFGVEADGVFKGFCRPAIRSISWFRKQVRVRMPADIPDLRSAGCIQIRLFGFIGDALFGARLRLRPAGCARFLHEHNWADFVLE